MKIFPILMDSQPSYLQCPPMGNHSLLLMPMGAETVLSHLCRRLAPVIPQPPFILSSFDLEPAYHQALQRSGLKLAGAIHSSGFEQRLWNYEPSDWLLIVDARRFPARGFNPSLLVGSAGAPAQGATHLVSLDNSSTGTKEYVQCDPEGRVRRIQRYYDSITWPFASEVSATLLPVACTLLLKDLTFESLTQLRHTLALLGVPSRDVVLPVQTFDLTDERGLLGLSERFTLDLAMEGGAFPFFGQQRLGEDGRDLGSVHPSARLVGPVLIHSGAVIQEEATIIGPAVVGASAWIGRGAVVAQSLVGPGSLVPDHSMIRHRVWLGHPAPSVENRRSIDVAQVSVSSRRAAGPLEVSEDQPRRITYSAFKLCFDMLLAAVTLVLLSPVLLLVAILVKLTSEGPAFYGDKREGKGGRVFRCWKFRTMRVDAETMQRELYAKSKLDGPQFKLSDDPRVTPLGGWLRRTNLDEIPQFVNVLCGQMSLVGPRPSPFRENQVCVPWREARLSIRPGITGLWQLCRDDRRSGDFHQWIYYDLLYVQRMSLWTDLKILIATVVTLGGRWRVPATRLIPQERSTD